MAGWPAGRLAGAHAGGSGRLLWLEMLPPVLGKAVSLSLSLSDGLALHPPANVMQEWLPAGRSWLCGWMSSGTCFISYNYDVC